MDVKRSGGSEKPNIIFMLADDLGYGDISSYGSVLVETPNIDGLAQEGMRFTRFYAGSAVCTPSRAAMLTGNFPLRYDIRQHFPDDNSHLPSGVQTLPSLLNEAGYGTIHIGKWHLGGLRINDIEARQEGNRALPGPLEHGFDHYLTNIEGPSIRPELIQQRRLYREGGHSMLRDDERAEPTDRHWTDIKGDEAIRWIEEYHQSNTPFYINLWFDVPHTPYEPAPEPHLSKYKEMGVTGDQLYFRSMVSHMDQQVGRIMDKLEELGIRDNTILVFTSDNGPAFEGDSGPFKGGKTDLHEGGIRVPMIASWPGQIPAGTLSFEATHMVDFLPTLAEAAGIDSYESVDGISLLDHLTQKEPIAARTLLWQMDLYSNHQGRGPKPEPYATTVAMKDQWKLLADSLNATELFNLNLDHKELQNKIEEEKKIREELMQALEDFHASPRNRWPVIEY
ncbi:sulfatase [Halalkalibaculum sp. DA384]|uniref:sulfatase family protein n=1 Tax=Halalkalibaculum sp. DA384 TaxID=3373606 RepID=UPI0037550A09